MRLTACFRRHGRSVAHAPFLVKESVTVCGIIGLLIKKTAWQDQLGTLVTPMIERMGTRGPDSAGLAVFGSPVAEGQRKFSLFAEQADFDWSAWQQVLHAQTGQLGTLETAGSHALATVALEPAAFKTWLLGAYPDLHVLSVGHSIRMFKDEGLPSEIASRYLFENLTGTHAVGHTRMATESAVSPAHAHPYTAGEDFCLVHNGSLSNPYSIRRRLERLGIRFETDNDTEAGCRYLEWRMREGDTLEEAIAAAFGELDGFFTFLMATGDRMVLVRDAFACKPAVAAETDEYVAVSSEFRSLAHLPGIQSAHVFEPAPEQIYSWAL